MRLPSMLAEIQTDCPNEEMFASGYLLIYEERILQACGLNIIYPDTEASVLISLS